ncbi:MAG: M23 family metallopeptidase [Chloroflexota bacterium]|nr:M23 family metallopeptidase [Chloroflexota bacterium]
MSHSEDLRQVGRGMPLQSPHYPLRLSRRTVLRALVGAGAGVLLTACGGDDLDPFAAGRQPTSPPSRTQDQAQQTQPQQAQPEEAAAQAAGQADLAIELPEPLVYVIPSPATQGQTVLVLIEAPGARQASLSWQGQAFSLLKSEDRFLGFFGIDANAPVGPQSLGVAVWGPRGEQLLWQETVIEIESVEWTIDNIQIDGPNAALLEPAIRQADETARLPFQSTLTPQLHWLGVFDPPSDGQITALYGEQRSFNGGPIEEYHTGIDFGGETGSSVTAANSGIVSWAGRTRRRGNGIIVDHGAGVFTGYYHLSEVLQTAGAVVEQGDLIARMGATGLATGPHLHWEVVVRGTTVNPLPWLRLLEFPDPFQELNPTNALTSTNLAQGS